MADVLAGGAGRNFERLPIATDCPNLWVVTTQHKEDMNPADVIGGAATREFMAWAKSHYDRVVLDSPPFGVVNDSAVLGRLVGSVLLVCRPGKSRKRPMRYAIRKLREVGIMIAGVVVNDVPIAGLRQFNYYYTQDDYNNYHRHSSESSRPAADSSSSV